MKRPGFLSALLLTTAIVTQSAAAPVMTNTLPSLGDSTSGVISQQQEYELGRTWLKILRSQTPTISDAQLKDYLERLLSRLSAASELQDHRLAPIIIDSPVLNAFAAPGGIIGVNTGLFIHADTEAQFAAVMAHELAHLSQRHYARNVEDARNKSIPTAAALLGSIIIMATAGADAGAAALTSTVAGIQSSRLRFSRQFEREADNLGIQTLVRAGFDSQAMPEIFEIMNKSSRYGGRPPEFLLTHPVTENRIADSRSRAAQLSTPKPKAQKDSFDYQLMRMRSVITASNNLNALARQFEKELETEFSSSPEITRYGLVLAYKNTRQYKKAEEQVNTLIKSRPDNLYYIMLQARIEAETGKPDKGIKRIDQALKNNPGNFPLLEIRARLLTIKQDHAGARTQWNQLSRMRPEDPDIWFELAEAQGLANDILGLHQSRAEFFFLTGNIDDAIKHLQYARKMVGDNFALKARLDQKLADMHSYRQKLRSG